MILSDFLSRQMHDTSNPHKIIPISFNMYNTLYETYYRIEITDQYLVQTHSQMKATGINFPEVHGARKTLITSMPLEKQKPQIQGKQVDKNRPKLGRGRAGMQCKHCNLLLTLWYQPINHLKYLPFEKILKLAQIFQYHNN